MHSNNQHLFVVGTIEYADVTALGKPACRAPEKIMFQFVGARLFEAKDLAALRIDPGHNVPNGAVLAAGIHPLKNQEQRIAVGSVVKVLQRAQLRNVFSQQFLILLLRLAKRLRNRRPLTELDLLPARTRKFFELIFIFIPSISTNCAGAPLTTHGDNEDLDAAFTRHAYCFRISNNGALVGSKIR